MQVSVVIPSYNRLHTLERAITSVFAQTQPAFEVIVVDDASTDGTREWLQRHHPAVKVIHTGENRGVSHARNLGITASAGDWIALLDSDDEWLPAKLEQQARLVQASREAVLCHTDEIWIRNGVRVNPHNKHRKSGGHIFTNCLPLCAISPSSALIRRDLFDQIGLFDESLPACEDYDLWLRICARHPVLLLDEPLLIKYGGHDDQLSRKYWGMDRFRVEALQKIIKSGVLGELENRAATTTLVTKLQILADGAEKRGRRQDADRWRTLLRQYQPGPRAGLDASTDPL